MPYPSTPVTRPRTRAFLFAPALAKGHCNDQDTMEGRTFLGALTGASLGLPLEGAFTEFARAQNSAQAVVGQSPFETSQVDISGNTIFVRCYGNGPAVLMVHGFPRREWAEAADVIGIECVGIAKSAPGGEFPVGAKVAALMGGPAAHQAPAPPVEKRPRDPGLPTGLGHIAEQGGAL